MSEGDVSTIFDEDVLRRMWQQTEDFGRKKEIRAHMYRLREERLRDLYTQPDLPSQRSTAKGHEFTTSQGHTKSFADQSFQSIKSKEVRDAGSPPRDYSYPVQELKDSSNAGWNVESENQITDDGHTHVKAVHAHVAGKYDVDGGSGSFAAVDKQRQEVTEYHDDHTDLKRNESASATSAHEQLSRKTEDGGTFSSTVSSSSSSSKFQQVSSSKHETTSGAPADSTDFLVEQVKRKDHETDQSGRSKHDPLKKVTDSQKFESTLRTNDSELMSRKVEFPDEYTKVIVETRTLPDGTQVTSTRREIRGPSLQTCHSEQHSQQMRSDSNTSRTTHSESNSQKSKKEILHNTFDRKEVDQNETLNKVHQEVKEIKHSDLKDLHQKSREFENEYCSHESNIHHNEFSTNEKSTKTQKYVDQQLEEVIEQTSNRKASVEDNHYQTTYKADFSDKKVSSDLSPTHQAWASTLRADIPSTQRGSVRGSSPGSRTFESSTSSLRSSISPDKCMRKPSRGESPTKFERQSPSHTSDRLNTNKSNNQYKTEHHTRNTSPEQKPLHRYAQSPSPTRRSPIKDSYRFIDEETKTSTKHTTDFKQVSNKESVTHARYSSPEKNTKLNPTPHTISHPKNNAPSSTQVTKHDEQDCSEQKPKLKYSKSPSPTRQSPIKDSYRFIDEETKTSTKLNTDSKQISKKDSVTHSRHSSPEKNTKLNPSPHMTSQTKNNAPSSTQVTKYDEQHCSEQKPKLRYSQSPSPTRQSPIKDSYRLIDEETKTSTKLNKDSEKISNKDSVTHGRHCSPEKNTKPRPSHHATKHTKDNAPSLTRVTKYDEHHRIDNYSSTTKKSTVDDDKTNLTTGSYSSQSPAKRQPSPPKVSFKNDTNEKQIETIYKDDTSDEITTNTSQSVIHARSPSPAKKITRPADIPVISFPGRGSKSPEKILHTRQGTNPLPNREPSPSKYGTYEKKKQHSENVLTTSESTKHTVSATDSVTGQGDSSTKKTTRASTSPVKYSSKDKYSSTSTDFIISERNREEINSKHTTPAHTRQLLTPSSSPTRKPKYVEDASSTGQSSPTTSVSEIMYFSSPRVGTHTNDEVVTDLDNVETYTEMQTEEDNVNTQHEKNRKVFEVKRSPSPTKMPCKSPKSLSPEKESPIKDNVPRKSSLKKPPSDTLLVSSVERPPTTFQVSPNEETKTITDHKIVKKDRANNPEVGSKIKERPPFARSETYEDRCRKILGMSNKDSLIIEAERTVSNVLDKLPIDIKPSESTKTSSSISPCSSPQREVSPINDFKSQRNKIQTIQDKKSHEISEFVSHEKETGEKNIHISRYVSQPKNSVEKPKTQSRESSPTKLHDIIYNDSTKANAKSVKIDNSESLEKIQTNNDIRQQTSGKSESARFSVSPQRKITDEPKKSNSRTPSPSKNIPTEIYSFKTMGPDSLVKSTINNSENFISSEKKQQIIERVQKTLRNISPNREHPESIRSTSRERSPPNTSTSLQNIVSDDSQVTEVNLTKRPNDNKAVIKKKSDSIITDKQKNTNYNKSTSIVTTKRPTQAPRTESPNKSRSISPKKAVSEKVNQYPQLERKTFNQINVDKSNIATQSSFTKKPPQTEFPTQRKPAGSEVIESRKNTNITKQNSFSKSTSVKSNVCTKNQSININKTVHSKSKMTSSTQVNIDSEDEQVGTKMIKQRSMEKGESIKYNAVTRNNKNTATPKPLVDLKITRTASDTSIKTSKTTPTRMKSKPEINISSISKAKTSPKQTASMTTRTVHQANKLKTEKPHSNLGHKPKSATTLNNTGDDDDIIIDIQQAKSSRENSPDKICPTPVSFLEETGKPRLPDEVSEPEDETYRRIHTTIHESESLTGDIVEISEDEEVTTKMINEVDRVTGSDECLLSVNDKVNKFLNKADHLNSTKDKSYRFKETEKTIHSDFVNDESDECLMSVSQKVNKFTTNEDCIDVSSKDRDILSLSHHHDNNPEYQDNYTKLSVNDKANLFVKTAEEIISPYRPSEPAPKVERPDLKNIHESLKSDDCLLSVSDKVNKFVQSSEKFTNETDDLHHSKRIDDEIYKKDHKEHKVESYAKETVSSHAKVRDSESPNIKSNERIPAAKITTLRSSEAVKKAKAMFENIASQQTDKKNETHFSKGTKLTDIGVFKKSAPTDSTMVLHPSLEDGSPNLTDTESEVDIAPHVRNTKIHNTNGSHEVPQLRSRPLTNGFPKSSEETPDQTSRKSPDKLRTKSIERFTKIDSHKCEYAYNREVTSSKNVLSRYPVGQKIEHIKEPQHEIPKKHSDRVSPNMHVARSTEIEKVPDEAYTSSHRGSGKFGVELRRTSVEQAATERRRSSASEPHHQPCIEDIFDLELLEQMLEKVVGYEQRRRIRAQMRLAKKATETEHFVDVNIYTKHFQTNKKAVNDVKSKTKSPDRKPTFKPALITAHPDKQSSHLIKKETLDRTEITEMITKRSSPERVVMMPEIPKTKSPLPQSSPDRKNRTPNPIKKTQNSSPEDKVRHPSPEKKVRQSSPEKKVRQPSPDKKTRPHSPSKTLASPKNKPNRFNEYASAYMRKVGLDEPTKTARSEVTTNKSFTETKEDHNTQFSSTMQVTIAERKSSRDIIDSGQVTNKDAPVSSPVMRRRAPSPVKKKQISNDHVHARTPSPDFKRPLNNASKIKSETISTEETKATQFDNGKKVITHKVATEEKPTWITNGGLKKTFTSETKSFSSKKVDTEKSKYRSTSPSKVIAKPTDVITSSYGLGPMDANGRPLFGIKALRNGASNYQVKGTVIRSEYHSSDGGEPAGSVSVTAYSTRPEDLARLLDAQAAPAGPVRDALHERARSRHHGLSAITTTKRFGGDTGATITDVHTKEEREALQQFSEHRSEKKTVRQSSVKSLTEKFIKNAVDTSKSDKSSYPKAGLILRSSGLRDTSSDEAGIARSDSEHSVCSSVDGHNRTVVREVTTRSQTDSHGGSGHDVERTTRTHTDSHRGGRHDAERTTRTHTDSHHGSGHDAERTTRTHTAGAGAKSFLDSNTKVTGVQDILTRMKNADIVIEDGDTSEDAEARALLNKFLGATVLMAGMESYVTEKPAGRVAGRTEIKTSRTVSGGGGAGGAGVASGAAGAGGAGGGAALDVERIWDEKLLRHLLEQCTDYEQRRRIRARLRQVMAEQEACADLVRSVGDAAAEESSEGGEREEVSTSVSLSVRRNSSEKTEKTISSTTTTTTKVSENASRAAPKSSPFAKFRQLEKQNSTSAPNSPKTPQSPGTPSTPLFKFTDPALQASAGTIKERLLQWCRDKTRDYENVKLLNFSTSWSDGLAFCALIHHFLPDAFDYSQLTADKRRHNFTLAFKIADEKAGIYPLLDVDDMVAMRKPDWKCVFTYVQAIYRRFKDQD